MLLAVFFHALCSHSSALRNRALLAIDVRPAFTVEKLVALHN